MENTQFFKNDWNKISIKDYFNIMGILDTNDDELEKNINILTIITNYSYDELDSMPFHQLEKLFKHTKFLNDSIKSIKIPDVININNRLYITNYLDTTELGFEYLSINKIISDLTISEYINFSTLADDTKNLHKILALFIKPIIYKKSLFGLNKKEKIEYDQLELEDFILNNLNIVLANSLMIFFSKVLNNLINNIRISLIIEIEKTTMKQKMMNRLRKVKILRRWIKPQINGDGYELLIELQKRLTELGMLLTN